MTSRIEELGSYTIERELGRGGMGIVYLGKDPRLGRQVALKTLPEQLASDPGRLARFEREAKTLASLNHPAIATIFALERADDGTNFLVLEYIEGISLSQRLIDKPISINEALTIARQVADGLAEAHKQGVIHRDLKPSNIMLLPDNSVKILDFGLAKAAVPADVELSQLQTVSMNVTQAGGVMGTPGYMSPEQARGLAVDTRSDIFSFGCLLYELLTRNTLFAGDTPSDALAQVLTSEPDWSQLPEGTPTKVLELLIRCLNKEPDERLDDISKAVHALAEGIEASRKSSSRVVSLDTPPSNLPASVTSFVGRQRELEELQNSFDHSRIVTLTGSGGCGKTRLGLKFAEQLLNKFPDGVWHVPLASLTGEGITQAVMSALGLKDEKGKSPSETLIDHLREKHILLLFDGCEHILGQCASLVETLLRSGPNICVLITSRQSLGLPGESNYRVPSLTTPDNIDALSPRELMEYESVRLFADRATASCPRFRMSEDLAKVIAEIVQKIDGIPLAIELAAARTRAMSLGQIARRLDNSFRLLRGGSQSSLERHQTLQATIDWSHSMLSEEEQILFRRLAVFNGGWTLEAAESVCQGDPIDEFDVIDLLSLLVEKSLVNFEEGGEGDRYKLLETVRQYATSKLEESSELQSTRQKHCEYFIAFAEEAEPHLRGSVDWLERSGHEIQNLLGAHRACEQIEDGTNLDLRLTGAVWRLFDIRGQYALGSSLLNEALARPGAHEPAPARAKALFGVGVLTMWRGDYDQGKIIFNEALDVARQTDAKDTLADAHNGLAIVGLYTGDNDYAQEHFEASLETNRSIGNQAGEATALGNLGELHLMKGEADKGRELLAEAVRIGRNIRSLSATSLPDQLRIVANLSMRAGDLDTAREHLRECITLVHEYNSRPYGCPAIESVATLALKHADSSDDETARKSKHTACTLFFAAQATRRKVGSPVAPSDREEHEMVVKNLDSKMSEEEQKPLQNMGLAMSFSQACETALAWLDSN